MSNRRSTIVTVFSCLAMSTAVAQGPIASYPFSGNAEDSSGNGLHGTVVGAVLSADRSGMAEAAYQFSGASDRITLPAGSIGMSTSVERTISFWMQPSSVQVAPNNGGVLSQYLHGDPSSSNFFIGLDQWAGVSRVNVAGNGVGRFEVPLNFDPVGRWTHVAVVLKTGPNAVQVYINGILRGSGTLNFSASLSNRSPVIGNIDGGVNADNFVGAIDDIQIFDRTLTSDEVALQYGVDVAAGLIAYYPFEGNAGDSSGHGLDGIVTGAMLAPDRFGGIDGAYLFGSASDRITMPPGSIGMSTATERSFAFWMKPSSVPVAVNNGGLISQYFHGGTSVSNFFIGIDQWAGVYRLNVSGNGEGRLDVPLPFDPIGKWTYVVVVMKAGTDNTKVYANGFEVLAGTVNYSSVISSLSPIIGDIDGGANSDNFPGSLDDIRVYDRVISPAMIAYLYQKDSASVSNGTPEDIDIVSVDSVDVNAQDEGDLPLRLQLANGRYVRAFEAGFAYPADLLEFISLDTSGTALGAAGWSYELNSTPGSLVIAAAGATPIDGHSVVGRLRFKAIGAPCQFAAVTLEAATVDTSSAGLMLVDGGVQILAVPVFGDVDQSGTVQAWDASLALRSVVGDTVLTCQQTANADVTLDGTVSALDATGILKRVVGTIPEFPYLPAPGGGELRIAAVKTGGTVKVDVSLASASNLQGIEGEVEFDGDVLAFSDSIWPSGYARTIDVSRGSIRWAASATQAVEGAAHVVTLVFSTIGPAEGTVVRMKRTRLNENPRSTALIEALVTTTDVDGLPELPLVFGLGQNYPNPFNPSTTVPFTLAEAGRASLRVFDVLGREVAVLADEFRGAGRHEVAFDASGLTSGVYVIQLSSGAAVESKKMILQK